MRELKILLFLISWTLSLIGQETKDYFATQGLTIGSVFTSDNEDELFGIQFEKEDTLCNFPVVSYVFIRPSSKRGEKINFYFDEKKVYTLDVQSCYLTLVFDFDLEENDIFISSSGEEYLVYERDQVILDNGELRQKIRLRSNENKEMDWIEGIGEINKGVGYYLGNEELLFVCAKVNQNVLIYGDLFEFEYCKKLSCLLPSIDLTYGLSETTVTFSSNVKDGINIQWDFGDGQKSIESDVSHTYANAGCYTVTLSAKSICSDEVVKLHKDIGICSRFKSQRIGTFTHFDKGQFVITQDDAFFVCGDNHFYKSFDKGLTWEKTMISNPSDGNKRFVKFLMWDQWHGILVQDSLNYPIVLVTENGGESWIKTDIPFFDDKNLILGKDGRAWTTNNINVKFYIRTLDFGKTWEKVSYYVDPKISKFIYSNEDTLFAFAEKKMENIENQNFICKSYNYGVSWTTERIFYDFEYIEFLNSNLGVVVDKDDKIFRTFDSGQSWEDINVSFTGNVFMKSNRENIVFNDSENRYFGTTDGFNEIFPLSCGNVFEIPPMIINRNSLFSFDVTKDTSSQVMLNRQWDFGKFSCVLVDEDGDGYDQDVDCDDNDSEINPSAVDVFGNSVDENCDGVDGFLSSSKDNRETDILIFPNPANEYSIIRIELNGEYRIDVINQSGFTVSKIDTRYQHTIENLKTGLYTLKIFDRKSSRFSYRKLIIVH